MPRLFTNHDKSLKNLPIFSTPPSPSSGIPFLKGMGWKWGSMVWKNRANKAFIRLHSRVIFLFFTKNNSKIKFSYQIDHKEYKQHHYSERSNDNNYPIWERCLFISSPRLFRGHLFLNRNFSKSETPCLIIIACLG